jgi:hypothetical protein
MTGDYMQTQPVSATSSPDAVMDEAAIADLDKQERDSTGTSQRDGQGRKSSKRGVNKATRQGALRIIQFKCIFIDGNIRSGDDEEHATFIKDLHKGHAIRASKVFNLYRNLTEEDVQQDEAWRFATVIVSTNRERYDINLAQCQSFARAKGVPVVRWRKIIDQWLEMPQEEILVQEAYNDPYFWQYFVPGSNAYCSDNLSVALKLANGTPVRLHSLSFATPEEEQSYLEAVNDDECSPGDIVTLEQAPLTVNVIPWPDEGEHDRAKYEPFAVATTECGQHVVPLQKKIKRDDKFCLIHGGDGWQATKAMAHMTHPFDLAFAITAHKAQGRTIDKVIIAIEESCGGSCYNFGFHTLFVAISRARRRDDVRLLFHGKPELQQLMHLERLRPAATVLQFLEGFRATGTWNQENALSKKEEMDLEAHERQKAEATQSRQRYGSNSKKRKHVNTVHENERRAVPLQQQHSRPARTEKPATEKKKKMRITCSSEEEKSTDDARPPRTKKHATEKKKKRRISSSSEEESLLVMPDRLGPTNM